MNILARIKPETAKDGLMLGCLASRNACCGPSNCTWQAYLDSRPECVQGVKPQLQIARDTGK